MLPKKQKKAYLDLQNSVSENEVFDKKTTTLLRLAASMALSCIDWIKHNFSVAKEIGITDDEIGIVQAIVMAVSCGKITNQFREAREKK